MELIREALAQFEPGLGRLALPVERLTLAKRRWRGVAEDGREFGFDLAAPLPDGAPIFQTATAVYFLAQKYEPVLELRLTDSEPNGARQTAEIGPEGEAGRPRPLRLGTQARLGWMIGNLHFQIEVTEEVIRVVDDPAVRQLFQREGLAFTACKRIFHPLTGGHRH